ncbi:glycosyltransferase [Zunongwangia sp. F363]|uniref:Glycosyltransferase n=1 Tax=Autumnicola tepida TaxID=3075595 RepID=A0ABU3C9P1_9FLAO|nr:glycosyltransferase [Zunongwangia sp. F363]MDT0643046.1 glycosyltransferase [Zunongwangia sp. F363]
MSQTEFRKDLVSIILPVFNGERFLAQSIQSCLAQTHKNFELIIVNDCSTDQSLKIAENFKSNDARISIISNKKNKKLPSSLNIGHEIALGNFITWTSDDNFFEEHAIEMLLKTIQQTEADIVYSNFNIIEESGKFRKKIDLENASSLLFGNSVGASFLYKKEVFIRNGGYDQDLKGVEDYDFWLSATLHSRFVHLEDILYNYRSHGKSLSSQLREAGSEENKLFADNLQKSYQKFLRNLAMAEQKGISDLLMRLHLYKEVDVLSYFKHYKEVKIILGKILTKADYLRTENFKENLDIRIRAAIQEYDINQRPIILWEILKKCPELLLKYDRKNSLKIVKKCLI